MFDRRRFDGISVPPALLSVAAATVFLCGLVGCAQGEFEDHGLTGAEPSTVSQSQESEFETERFAIPPDEFCKKENTENYCVEERGFSQDFCDGVVQFCQGVGDPEPFCNQMKKDPDQCVSDTGSESFCRAMGEFCKNGTAMQATRLKIEHVQGFCDGPCKPAGSCDGISSPVDYCADINEENEAFCKRRQRMLDACKEAVDGCSSNSSPGCEAMTSGQIPDACENLIDSNGSCEAMKGLCTASKNERINTALVEVDSVPKTNAIDPKILREDIRPGFPGRELFRDKGSGADETAGDNTFTGIVKLSPESLKTLNGLKQESIELSEIEGPLEDKFSADFAQRQKPNIPSQCDTVHSTDNKTLFWVDTDTVESDRTLEVCNTKDLSTSKLQSIDLDKKVWSFGHLMDELAPADMPTHLFIREWLNEWKTDRDLRGSKNSNGIRPVKDTIPARIEPNENGEINDVISKWETLTNQSGLNLPQDALSPKLAPFRLLAIVNRNDLAGSSSTYSSGGEAGEGRLVFGYVDPESCSGSKNGAREFTVIFEYNLPSDGAACPTIDWAREWQDLDNFSNTQKFNDELAKLTTRFTENDGSGSGPNGSHLAQLRTNEGVDNQQQLREFSIQSCTTAPQSVNKNGTTPNCCEDKIPGHSVCPLRITQGNTDQGLLSSTFTAQTPQQEAHQTSGNFQDGHAEALVKWINNEVIPDKFWPFLGHERSNFVENKSFVPNGQFIPGQQDVRGGHSNVPVQLGSVGHQHAAWWDPSFTDSNGSTRQIDDRTPSVSRPGRPSMRHGLSMNTCNGCHGGETVNVSRAPEKAPSSEPYFHVSPRAMSAPSFRSKFVVGNESSKSPSSDLEVEDPVDTLTKHRFDRLEKRKNTLKSTASSTCSAMEFLSLVHRSTH